MPTAFYIQTMPTQTNVSLKDIFAAIRDNASKSKFLNSIGRWNILLQEHPYRIILLMHDIHYPETKDQQQAREHIDQFLKDIQIRDSVYIESTKSNQYPFSNRELMGHPSFQQYQTLAKILLTISLKAKTSRFNLEHDSHQIGIQLRKISDQIKVLLNNQTIEIFGVIKNDQICELQFLNFKIDSTDLLLHFKGNVVLKAIQNNNLQDTYEIVDFNLNDFIELSKKQNAEKFSTKQLQKPQTSIPTTSVIPKEDKKLHDEFSVKPKKFISTISFFVFDEDNGEPFVTPLPLIESQTPRFIKAFINETRCMCKKNEIQFHRNEMSQVWSADVTIELITDEDFTNDNKTSLFDSAFNNSLLCFDPKRLEVTMTGITSNLIDDANFEYKGKVEKESRVYDKLNCVIQITNEYINEYGMNFTATPKAIHHEKDTFGRIIGTFYEYPFSLKDQHQNESRSLEKTKEEQFQKTSEDLKKQLVNLLEKYKMGSLGSTTSLFNSDYDKILRVAIVKQAAELVRFILDNVKGIDVNKQDNTQKRTLLHLAVTQQSEEIAKMLLKAGAKTDIGDAKGKTVIMHAEEINNEKILTVLGIKTNSVEKSSMEFSSKT